MQQSGRVGSIVQRADQEARNDRKLHSDRDRDFDAFEQHRDLNFVGAGS